jgi:hypothetical protein
MGVDYQDIVGRQSAFERLLSCPALKAMLQSHRRLSAQCVGHAASAKDFCAGAANASKVPHCCQSARTKTSGRNCMARNGGFGRLGMGLFKSMA